MEERVPCRTARVSLCVVQMGFFFFGGGGLGLAAQCRRSLTRLIPNGETSLLPPFIVAFHQFCVRLGGGNGENKKEQSKEQRGEAISQLQEKVPALPTFSINRRENLPFLALTLVQSTVPARFNTHTQGSDPCIL